jgi:peroxiredoxin
MVHRLPVLSAIVLAVGAASCSSTSVAPPPAEAAEESAMVVRLPAVGVATLTGEPAEVARLASGRVALLSFWATWCDACDKEMDALNRLHAKTLEGHDAVVIGVAVGEDREKVAAFARRRGLRYAQVVDEHFALADALGQRRLPATVVVDRKGRIVYRGEALDAGSLEAMRKAIAEP